MRGECKVCERCGREVSERYAGGVLEVDTKTKSQHIQNPSYKFANLGHFGPCPGSM